MIGNDSSGMYNFRQELMQRLLDEGYCVAFSVPYGEYVSSLKEMGCEYVPIEYDRSGKKPLKELKLITDYRRLLKKGTYDAVLLYTIKPTLYAGFWCRMRKIPYLVNITGLSPAVTEYPLLRMFCFMLYRFVLKRAEMVFFQNEQNRYMFEKAKAVGLQTRLLPGSGVNLNKHRYEEYTESGLLRILYVGRIFKLKGISEWLDAIHTLQKQNAGLIFEFVGECDEEYKDVIAKLNRNGKIRYYGVSRNPHEYMKRAQAVIMPSYSEGMSNVLLEASACGRPILASRVQGCREILVEGVTGFGFEPHSSKSILEAVRKFLELTCEERRQMGRKGRRYVEKHFSRELIIEAYMQEIKKICGR